ncbi:thiamine biosynthesis protein ThiS [Pseudoxanthomonas wuyuanensis]|uniref:Thiamine biosynthesis protein ThiS n=2 Tax=Pseudoxanthomonas wuyuanensis TaxID=1073196 RepID=A0A286D3V4_9GAMM|nr:thiamine biosynthesis protein ThiS [Pseudoxanthomonas wuyuanensis]
MAGMVSPSSPAFTLQRVNAQRASGRDARWLANGDNGGMNIQLNGQSRQIPAASTLSTLLLQEGLAERRVAVEVNGEIVPRGLHGSHALHEGDRVEIVHALGGG